MPNTLVKQYYSCVVAGRLANLDHNLQVLLIEAGESNLNNPWVYRPGIYPRNMKLDSKTASFYYSRPSEFLAGRRAVVPCAHILGGGSSINFMMYTRASASDCKFGGGVLISPFAFDKDLLRAGGIKNWTATILQFIA